jgi:glycosyltransferase involved in cell wall biosynthesis
MASGLPVVAFDYAAAAELITPGVSGMLVPRDDAAQFARAAVALAERAEVRRLMGQAARRQAARHDWGEVLAAFEAVLHDAAYGAAGVAGVVPGGAVPEAAAPRWVRATADLAQPR